MINSIKKVVIIGPESTGKSTLSQQLANYYKTEWCPEYAREYLLNNGVEYDYDDLLTIAKGQLALEDSCEKKVLITHQSTLTPHSSPLLFIDTDLYVMKVWCEFVYGQCHHYIEDQIASRKYDLYLLCNIDLPWVQDKLREYPDEKTRKELYEIYKNLLQNQPINWVEISGKFEERFQKAIDAVEGSFS